MTPVRYEVGQFFFPCSVSLRPSKTKISKLHIGRDLGQIFCTMLVSNPFLSIVYQFGQAVMQDSWMTFLKFKNDVLVLSSMLPARQEPYRYFINLDGYLLITSVLKDV